MPNGKTRQKGLSMEEIVENQTCSVLAVTKIAAELESFKGGQKEIAVSKFVASTLTHFCEQNERFAEVVYKTTRTLSDCCAEIMDGCGNQISDIDVYRGAVKSYFPNADISFKMDIQINGDAPDADELNREPKKKITEVKRNVTANNITTTPLAEEKKQSETMQLSLFD